MTADQLAMLEKQYLERNLLERGQAAAAELVLYAIRVADAKISGMRRLTFDTVLLLVAAVPLHAQSTQAYLAGNITDSITGLAIANASISCRSLNSDVTIPGRSSLSGRFTFAALSPGQYGIRVDAAGYQSQELHLLDLPIAGRLDLEFRLRPENDVWEARQYQSYLLPGSHQVLTFYGPDLDTSRVASFDSSHGTIANLETSVSSVIDSRDLGELPLTGRDAYALLVLLPGVTADTTTARGLGFSVNGQRPSSANYLLDGLENNNLLVTGPLGVVAPEALEEYRISTNNFSAEFGRTSGFLANAISRSGTNEWHGMAYLHLKNEFLNANGFQENTHGIGRAPLKEVQPGFTASGPILKKRLFASGALQLERFRGRNDPQQFGLPTAQFIASTSPASIAGTLLREFPAAAVPTGLGEAGIVTLAPPVQLDQVTGLARLDYLSGEHRLFARAALDHERQPDLLYNPYPGFSSPFHQGSLALGAGWTWQIGSSLTEELRVGRTGDGSRYDRPHSEVPVLQLEVSVTDPNGNAYPIDLPGSASSFGYRDLSQNWEAVENWSWVSGRHTWKFGGGLFERTTESAFTEERDGIYQFETLATFAAGTPAILAAAYDRAPPGIQPVPYNRTYRAWQFDAFAQDQFRVTPRLTLSYGLRYDRFGAPENVGPAKDFLLALGPGAGFVARLQGVHYQPIGSGNQSLFNTDNGNLGPRFGFSYDIGGTGQTMVRGSYGIFYDRPFDNLWQIVSINRQIAGVWSFTGPVSSLSTPLLAAENQGTLLSSSQYHNLQLFQPNLRNPTIQSAFMGIRRNLADGIALELNALASRGRTLWTTDDINRFDSLPASINPNRRYIADPAFGDIDYLSNQGQSDYTAFTSSMRFVRRRWNGQISYTWSHSIDNQSDPLAGIFEDFNQAGIANKPDVEMIPGFTQQFASSEDRGNSDFDQRHNLVFFAIYSLPTRVLNGWQISGLGAIRSGLPFSVYAPPPIVTSGGFLNNQRADLTALSLALSPQVSNIPGGKVLLNSAAFATPAPLTTPDNTLIGRIGNTGRNAFTGPGLISADFSISRHFDLSSGNEKRKATLRADFYNVLNHANLNNPQTYLTGPHFGQALYGREEKNSGFPLLAPLNETSRQVQLFLRFEF